MANDNVRKDSGDGAPRRFAFSLSTAGMVSLAVVAVAALAWAFVLGVLVGRGYKPEQAVPELARMMPEANATAPQAEQPGVLKAEELNFYDNLNKKPEGQEAAEAEPAAPAAKPKAAPEPKPEPEAEPPAPQAAPTQATPAPEPEPAPAPAPPAVDATRYAYVYQVGSVRSAPDAEKFAKRLEGLGLKTSIQTAEVNGATWHRIMVHFQGTSMETEALKDILKSLGITQTIMKSKTPL